MCLDLLYLLLGLSTFQLGNSFDQKRVFFLDGNYYDNGATRDANGNPVSVQYDKSTAYCKSTSCASSEETIDNDKAGSYVYNDVSQPLGICGTGTNACCQPLIKKNGCYIGPGSEKEPSGCHCGYPTGTTCASNLRCQAQAIPGSEDAAFSSWLSSHGITNLTNVVIVPSTTNINTDFYVYRKSGSTWTYLGHYTGSTNIIGNELGGSCISLPSLSGFVFSDTNGNGTKDTGEAGVAGVTIKIGSSTRTTSSTGAYSFSGLLYGTSFTITLDTTTLPANYTTIGSASQAVNTNTGSQANINFGIVPSYSISGNVFNDSNKNYVKDAGEGKDWSDAISIGISPSVGTATANSTNGTFSITKLPAGTYTVILTSSIPPNGGYENLFPKNGAQPQFSVTVGAGCTYSPQHPNSAGRATCNAGDISGLNFVITNSIPWFQTYGLDVRLDNGFVNFIPSTPTYSGFMSTNDNF